MVSQKKKIGIIGCGAMGSQIALYLQSRFRDKAIVSALSDIDSARAKWLANKIRPRPLVAGIEDVIKKSDLVIEAASAEISGQIAEEAITLHKDVLIMSTGGLLDKLHLFEKARLKGIRIYIPSGAICGLDGLASASVGKIKKVILTTRKPIQGFRGSQYLAKHNIILEKIGKETLLFSGSARDAIKYFPQNINVAVTLSLCGVGPDKTMVRIFTSPVYTRNIHEILVEGQFGRFFTRTENVPSKENPKTSQLAIFSAMAKLKEILETGRR